MKVTVKGVDLNVAHAGSGEHALVFLHFWGGSSREWSSVMDGLSPRFHCVALDARGSGASDAPGSGYRIADLADDVEGAIAALKLKSYVLVGHSMGGKTAQLLASRRPPGLRGLALVASSPPTPMATSPEHRDRLRNAYASREAVNLGLNNVLTASPISDKDREVLIADALKISPGLRDGWIDVASQEDQSSEVAKVDVPVVVIAGDADKVDPLDVVKAHILPAFRDPEIHVLRNKGHLLPVEASRELVEILSTFAARVFV